ncbi:sensor histidine kinase [Sphingomonas ginkgonis]|uniref:histidine kinase n=1 Tax=Sphingomonas ginkgonis TaxID=2315330 RepID=A0A3R9WQH8_9SPHN|nr:HAMP domain-containing sensor histidine kinase [Sphingomonas ginkgonis]RST30966.1 sensor histidine kinase [Sphingomonas ginkgonis]
MASAAELPPFGGLLDRVGHLVEADEPLARLQQEAGSALGQPLAVPQLAALARLARRLGVPISRPIIAAGARRDIDLWVRAEPADDQVRLIVERWTERPPASPRWALALAPEPEPEPSSADEQWSTDRELRITRISDGLARWLAITPEAALGNPLTRLVRLEEDEEGAIPLMVALAGRRGFSGQAASPRSAGSEPLLLAAEVLTDPAGQFAGFEGRATLAAAEASRSAAAVAQASSDVDHALDEALRSPLDRIIAEAEQIVDRSEGPLRSDYAAYASDIVAAGRHLLEVIRAMGKEPAEEDGRVDLGDLAREAVGLVEKRAQERSVNLVASGERGALPVRGQSRAIVQILVNLIGNAVRHSPQGGQVELRFGGGPLTSVTIADRGPGIALQDQQRIFERFEQAGQPREGAGLGLAISRRLARAMGGDIHLESVAGQGARFTLMLPAA